jgi:molecular chaperone HtpG
VQQDAFIQAAVGKGFKVIKLETMVDAAFINNVEMKWEGVQFVRVDADVVDNLIDKQENVDSVLSKDEVEQAKKLFEFQIPETTITVEVKGLSQDVAPVIATRPEFMRRMKDMASMQGGMGAFYASMPDEVTLTVNGNHPLFKNILSEPVKEKQEKIVHNLADLALLSQGLLKGNTLTSFINRSVDLMS